MPLFLILHLGFSYYFGTWKAARHGRRIEIDDVSRDQRRLSENRGWVALLVGLITLKAGAVRLVYGLLDDAHALASPLGPNSNLDGASFFIDFVVFPLAVAATDHSADMKTALNGDFGWAWANLVQSMLQTYFFLRPLAAITSDNIDPRDGRIGTGILLLATAVWVSLPGIPSTFFLFGSTPSPI